MEELNKTYRKGLIIAILIIALPLFNYFHLLFSETSHTIIILSYEIHNSKVVNQVWAWSILNFLAPLFLLLLLYYTTHAIYKYLFLPLIALYVVSTASAVGLVSSIFTSPFSIEKILIVISSILFLLAIEKKTTSKFRTLVLNQIIAISISNRIRSSLKNTINKILRLKEDKVHISTHHYLRKLIYLKKALQDHYGILLLEKTAGTPKQVLSVKITAYLLILLMYGLWFLPLNVPEDITYFEVLGWRIGSFGFKDVSLFIWFASRKLVIILFLSMWFITSSYWWRYAIISPLILYSYQFWETFQDVSEVDSIGNLRVFPLVLINVALVIVISRIVRYRTRFMAVYVEVSREVEELLDKMKSDYPKEIAAALNEIRNKKKKGRAYREQLKALENELAAKLGIHKG